MPEMTTVDFDKLASSVLKRRTHLSWESWQQFYDDVHAVAFIEAAKKENGDITLECSCATGLEGTLTLSLNDFAANYFSLIRLRMHPQARHGAKVGLQGACEQDPSSKLGKEVRQAQKNFKPDSSIYVIILLVFRYKLHIKYTLLPVIFNDLAAKCMVCNNWPLTSACQSPQGV